MQISLRGHTAQFLNQAGEARRARQRKVARNLIHQAKVSRILDEVSVRSFCDFIRVRPATARAIGAESFTSTHAIYTALP